MSAEPDLDWRSTRPPRSPWPPTDCDHPDGGALVLGVLGASHVITVEHTEPVSPNRSHATSAASCPSHTQAPGYELESRTDIHDESAFRRLAHRLRECCARETGWLGGTFPGDDAALTALAAEPDGAGWRWQTWHLYPAAPGGTIVYTASRWRP